MNDVESLLDVLPYKLKVEISLYIYEKQYKSIKFFKGVTSSFITWFCPLLKPVTFEESQYIFIEGDDIDCIYFLLQGKTSFVLPQFDNTEYINVDEGQNIGLLDIVGSVEYNEEDIEKWMENKEILKR